MLTHLLTLLVEFLVKVGSLLANRVQMSGMSGIKSGTRSNGSISSDRKTQDLRESHKSVGYIC